MSTLSLRETTETLSAGMSAGAVNLDFDMTVVAQMVFFAILVAILKPLLFDPMMRLFEERERQSDGARLSARKMDEKAGHLLQTYEAELEKVRRAANEEREKLRAEGQALEAGILAEARAETSKFLEQGSARMAREAQTVRDQLRSRSGALGQELATLVLGREVG